jgi:hypothetical protein
MLCRWGGLQGHILHTAVRENQISASEAEVVGL